MSSRRDVLAGLAALSATGRAGVARAAAHELKLDEPQANLEAYIKLRGDLRPEPVFDMARGRVFGLVDGQSPRPLFKTVGAQRSEYRRISALEYRLESRYVGLLLDWETEEPLQSWINPYNERKCDVPVTQYGPGTVRLFADGMMPSDSDALPSRNIRPWFLLGDTVHMVDQIMSPAPSAAQPDGDSMTFSGDAKQLADPGLTRIPSRLSFTAVEHWRDWMQMAGAGSLWWHVSGAKLDTPDDYPASLRKLLTRHDADFFHGDAAS